MNIRIELVAAFIACTIIAAVLSGCAVMPSSALLEENHISSASQHMRGCNDSNLGYNATMVFLHWRPTASSYIDLGEGISYQASVVPHHPETFQGRFGIELCLKDCK